MWKISFSAIADKPLLGHGRGSFSATYGSFQEAYFSGDDFILRKKNWLREVLICINEYLQIAVEWGIHYAAMHSTCFVFLPLVWSE
jgi:O-antigen ligase